MPYFNSTELRNVTSVNSPPTQVSNVINLDATSARVLTAAESGSIVYFPQTTPASLTITLPAVAYGLNFRFVSTGSGDGAGHTRSIAGAANGLVNGIIIGASVAAATAKNALVYSATAANTKPGDYAIFTCDGTNWYCQAFSAGTAVGWSLP